MAETKKQNNNDYTWVIKKPRITEKAAINAEANRVYTFNIHQDAKKGDVMNAIKTFYKVNPVKINISNIPSKNVRSRRTGKKGVKSGGRKAMVYLKEGDKIEFV